MMRQADITRLAEWFSAYCASFTGDGTDDDRRNYLLKERHTARVREAAVVIATALGCGDADLLLAEAAGLLHDVGRFPQYREYRTFRDSVSVNHAARSVRVMADENILADLAEEERRIIIRSVALHNVYRLPGYLDERETFFLKLVRDADKLDIWRVFLEYYSLPEEERASAVGLGFPDQSHCSPEVLATLRDGRMINLSDVRTLNDFKLLQLSWVYDLNFRPSRELFRERGYLEAFSAVLPPCDGVQAALGSLDAYLDRAGGRAERSPGAGGSSWIP